MTDQISTICEPEEESTETPTFSERVEAAVDQYLGEGVELIEQDGAHPVYTVAADIVHVEELRLQYKSWREPFEDIASKFARSATNISNSTTAMALLLDFESRANLAHRNLALAASVQYERTSSTHAYADFLFDLILGEVDDGNTRDPEYPQLAYNVASSIIGIAKKRLREAHPSSHD